MELGLRHYPENYLRLSVALNGYQMTTLGQTHAMNPILCFWC